ncbi:MAG: hypothetical protein KDB61_14480, partial [Planctomycetes bacterium]|nr:hypothetical protein [Planctomycetota bacterium]
AGRFDGGWQFRFEPKFDESGVELEEAWVGKEFRDGKDLVRLGRMKAPFGLEETRSRRHIHFPRFSVLNQFSPAEDHGVFVTGQEGRFEFGYALYNGTGGADEDSEKDVALQGIWHGKGSASTWELGAALTFGRQGQDVGGDGIKNASGMPVLEFAGGSMLDGDRTRLQLEGAWFHGPLMVQAEVLAMRQEATGGGAAETLGVRGFYLDVARTLTGEAMDFHGVASPDESWILALRASSLTFDSDWETPGILTAGTYTDSIESLSLGLNYVPNSHVIVRHAWSHSWYGDTVTRDGAAIDDEGMFTVELQLHF